MRNVRDALIGLAVGDALGVPVEFESREDLKKNPVVDMRGFGSHPVPAGSWSDDTSMTIATMDSIINCHGIDYKDIMDRFLLWVNKGEYTPTGTMFDIGHTCRKALMDYAMYDVEPTKAGQDGNRSNGNGSLMRILPIPFFCHKRKLGKSEIIKICNDVSSLTHRHEISKLGCYIYTLFVMGLLDGMNIQEAYDYISSADYDSYSKDSLSAYRRILEQDITTLKEEEIQSTGYVVHTLEAALWCLFNAGSSFDEIVLAAVNLGEDTDTTGAVVGSLAGLVYECPQRWKRALLRNEYLCDIADSFGDSIAK